MILNYKKRQFHIRYLKKKKHKKKVAEYFNKQMTDFLKYQINATLSEAFGIPPTLENKTTFTMETLLDAYRKFYGNTSKKYDFLYKAIIDIRENKGIINLDTL